MGETGRRLLRWDANGKLLSSHALPGSLGGLRFSPGARRLAVLRYPPPAKGTEKDVPEVNQSSAVVLDTMTGRPLVTLKQPDSLEPALAFSPDEQTLATVTASYRHEKEGHVRVGLTVRLWELCSGKERKKIELKSIPSAYGPPHVAVGPGGRVLAVGREDQRVQLFDAITGAELAFLPGSDTALGGLAFRPDGKALVTGHADGAILIWDLARVRVPALRPPADRAAAWADLASLDAKKAHAAGWALAADPGAVAFIRQHLAPARPTDAARLKQLLTDLGNARFAVRQKAMRELDALGDRARAALRGWLGENPPLEVRQRIEQLLARLDG
ncbi:MAG: hypothetical protein IT429_12095, partial [Gemmataceae bacterium]|nr:hypothetical protein [Gemmataceae bacterium]